VSRRQRIGLIGFFAGLLLLNNPVVNIVNEPTLVAGIPKVFLYVLAVWLLLIVVAFVVSLDDQGT
jgi:hypothetical protein